MSVYFGGAKKFHVHPTERGLAHQMPITMNFSPCGILAPTGLPTINFMFQVRGLLLSRAVMYGLKKTRSRGLTTSN